MENLERIIKIGLATLLLAMLVALGGLAAVATTGAGNIAALLPGAQIAAQQVAELKASQVATTPTQQTTTGQQSAQAQPNSVLDARGVVHKVGPAVVTVVNNLQASSTGGFGRRGTG